MENKPTVERVILNKKTPVKKVPRKKAEPLMEIVRSFSFKLNVGNYESRDFFCSQKAECKAEDADKVSQALYDFCKREVLKAVNEFKEPDFKKIKDEAKTEAQLDAGGGAVQEELPLGINDMGHN